jgi:translocation and assembly module TamA
MIVSLHKVRMPVVLQLALACLLFLACISSSHATVSISGVDKKTRQNIIAHLRLDDEACDAPEWRIRRLFSESEEDIREALEVVGYYDIEISRELTIKSDKDCWHADFTVIPGKPVVLRNVSIEIITAEINTGGVPDEQLDSVVRECALRTGDVLQHEKYESCRRDISFTAQALGYFNSEFTERRIDVYPAEHAADITLHFKTGRRYVFGEAVFEQAVLHPDLVKRAVTFTPGQFYDAELIRRMQRDLMVSSYYDQVVLTSTPRGEPYYDVPVHIKLTPGKKFQYNAGIGFATDVGPKLRFGVLNRRVNSKGHQAEFEINLSKVISDVGVSYRIPLDRQKDWFTIDAMYKTENNDSFKSDLFSTGVQHLHKRDDGWMRTLFTNLRLEEYETGEFDNGRSRLLTPGISYSFIEEDYPPRPIRGHRSSVTLQGAVKEIVSDTSFLQIFGKTKWAIGLWTGARLLTRAEAGATLIDELDTLPASVRFFAGGDISVRGYGYESLGPTDDFGAVIGGQNLLVASIEFDQKFSAGWSWAVFVDSGNAYDRLSEFSAATGVGAGFRWYSPLGPIRFDLAFPLDKDAPDEYRIHVTLGPDL